MKTKLIQALRSAAAKLRGGCEYEWTNNFTCNCGVLASVILGRALDTDDHWITPSGMPTGNWTNKVQSAYACEATGIPMHHVYAALRDAGVGVQEVEWIEHCTNPSVLARLGYTLAEWEKQERTTRVRSDRAFVADYFDTWADMLAEELTSTQDQVPAIESKDVQFQPAQILKRMEAA